MSPLPCQAKAFICCSDFATALPCCSSTRRPGIGSSKQLGGMGACFGAAGGKAKALGLWECRLRPEAEATEDRSLLGAMRSKPALRVT